MPTALPILQPVPIFKNKDYREVLVREMEGGKIPISLGKTCPVKCEFCYEIDHSYRETLDPPKTTDEDWKFILDYISRKPTDPMQFWCLGGNEYMEWTDLFLHPKAMEWVEDFLTSTDKNITFFTVGPKEARAWPLRRGSSAVEAAGKIHSDIARGFIRAEVISTPDMLSAKTHAEAQKRGVMRVEGRDYVVADGDVINVRFNV